MSELETSDRERAMIEAILDFQSKRGYSPTVRDLQEILGTSRGTTHRTLQLLREKGLVVGTLPRTMRVVSWE